MTFWNQAFDTPHYKYGTAPNAFVRAQAHRLEAASQVLVPGDGEGRNGVWLAQQGHEVLSVDSSDVGLRKAQALAARHGVLLGTLQADLATWAPAPASVGAVVLTFVHLPPAIRRAAHRRLAAALRPGGWLLLEAFHPLQLGCSSGGPQNPQMLYTLEMLRGDAGDLLDEVEALEGLVQLDEGPGHQGAAQVVRWLARARTPAVPKAAPKGAP